MKIFSALKSWFATSQRVTPMFNKHGLMLGIESSSGAFETRNVNFQIKEAADTPWYIGEPIALEIRDGKLWMRRADVAEHTVFEGSRRECQALLLAIRQLWLDANLQTGAHALKTVMPFRVQGFGDKRRFVALCVLCAALASLGVVGAYLYLRPMGPGLDLTSMSVQDIARLDANPVAVRELQEQFVAAMKVGQADAKKLNGKIEEDHLQALKAMGLQTGVSVKNAMSCLAIK